MASVHKYERKLPLTLLVDKEKNRVVLAETSGDIVDILFGFLTLPLGTIIRIVSKNQHDDEPSQQETIGCIKNLYKSVENFSDRFFRHSECKAMLLYPHNNCESLCQNLKLNVDDSKPTKYFTCKICGEGVFSIYSGVICCEKFMVQVENVHHRCFGGNEAGFVKKGTLYLIFDDLKVLQSFPGNTLQQLQQLGYRNINELIEMHVTVGLKEILDLLKKALTSKFPLSNVFLANGELCLLYPFSLRPPHYYDATATTIMNLKVTVSKSKKKILYAEAERDFVNFLFSFLTTPVGSVLEQLKDTFSFGCMNNLHKNMKELNPSCFIRPLKDMNLFDAKSPYGKIESTLGIVKRPSQFVVWDNLQVTPLDDNISSIAFLQKLNIPLDDLEQHVVSIRETQALYLLGASLTSSEAALTEALFHLLKINP